MTQQTAKPAVSFGGKYRIIDFPLSNCINSGIDTVGVLTQYQPLALNEYIGNGAPWDLDRARGGLSVLPPYQGNSHADWYKGTANAIYQNIQFIEKYHPDYVLILSGDHIYKMDYAEMLLAHKEKGAVCTVATIAVPMEEASRFGICNVDADGRMVEFEEKPKQPKNNQASMGIYIFNTDVLISALCADEEDPTSSNDFGKNIIPKLLSSGASVYTYPFEGYWKDVGTIGSLWEANMDLLGHSPRFKLQDRHSRIFSKNMARAPQYIGDGAVICDSLISEGSVINGHVENSVLSGGVIVDEGAEVYHSVIMSDVHIQRGAKVYYAIIDSDSTIGSDCIVGNPNGSAADIRVVAKGSVIDNQGVAHPSNKRKDNSVSAER